MTEKLKNIIKEEVMKLPKEMREAINAFDWVKIAEEIGKKYLLNESEINDFQVETLLVLVGLEDGDSYALNIEDNIGTSKDEAVKMADEAFEKIFNPISNTLEENIKKNLQNKKPSPEQTVDFILSGGDYSAFVENIGDTTLDSAPNMTKPIGTSSILDVKDKLIDINNPSSRA